MDSVLRPRKIIDLTKYGLEPEPVPDSSVRKVLTLEQRMDVLKRHENGQSYRKIAAALGVGKTQIQRTVQDKDLIKAEWEQGGCLTKKYVKPRHSTYRDLNMALWEWFCDIRSKGYPMTGRILQKKALVLALEMGLSRFRASNGWLESFKKRHNVMFTDVSCPKTVKPGTVEPGNVKPVTMEPENVKPVTVEPVTVEPVTVEPENVKPVTVEPVNVEPVTVESVTVKQEI